MEDEFRSEGYRLIHSTVEAVTVGDPWGATSWENIRKSSLQKWRLEHSPPAYLPGRQNRGVRKQRNHAAPCERPHRMPSYRRRSPTGRRPEMDTNRGPLSTPIPGMQPGTIGPFPLAGHTV